MRQRRSVLVRMTLAGERIGKARIINSHQSHSTSADSDHYRFSRLQGVLTEHPRLDGRHVSSQSSPGCPGGGWRQWEKQGWYEGQRGEAQNPSERVRERYGQHAAALGKTS